MRVIRGGDVFWVAAAASCQFAGRRAILFRVIREHGWSTYAGYVWLDGYELCQQTGDAKERRSIFVQRAGLQLRAATWRARRTA